MLRALSYLAPVHEPLYLALVDALGRRLKSSVSLGAGAPDYHDLASADLAFICGLAHAQIGRPFVAVAAPLLTGARYRGRPEYYSDVIVPTASSARSFADLRGVEFVFNEPRSQSGYGVVAQALRRRGEDWSFFGSVRQVGSHAAAVAEVAAGQAGAAAVDSHVLGYLLRSQPSLAAAVRVVESLGPSPVQPVVMARRLGRPVRQAVTAALLTLHRDHRALPVLRAHGVERFAAVTDRDYASLIR